MRDRRIPRLWSKAAAPAALALALGLVISSCAGQPESPVAPSSLGVGSLNSETEPTPTPTVEPTPTPTPTPEGVPCSPGYWKNHLEEFNAVCGAAADLLSDDRFRSCDDLMTALTCRGSDESCGRSAAAAALNAVSGCTED